jgi:hypothetical protein
MRHAALVAVVLAALISDASTLPSPVLTFDDDAASTTIGFTAKTEDSQVIHIGSEKTCTKVDGSPRCLGEILADLEQQFESGLAETNRRLTALEAETARLIPQLMEQLSLGEHGFAPTAEAVGICAPANMSEFISKGVVGHGDGLGLELRQPFHGYGYGTLSAAFGENMERAVAQLPLSDITDGRHIIWGSDGQVGEPGGVELYFPDQVNLKSFQITCRPGSCDAGMYHFSQESLQFWNGENWKAAEMQFVTNVDGSWDGGDVSNSYSHHWRLLLDYKAGTQGEIVDISELSISQICERPAKSSPGSIPVATGALSPDASPQAATAPAYTAKQPTLSTKPAVFAPVPGAAAPPPPVLSAPGAAVLPVLSDPSAAAPPVLSAPGAGVLPGLSDPSAAAPPVLSASGAVVLPGLSDPSAAAPPVLSASGAVVLPGLSDPSAAAPPAARIPIVPPEMLAGAAPGKPPAVTVPKVVTQPSLTIPASSQVGLPPPPINAEDATLIPVELGSTPSSLPTMWPTRARRSRRSIRKAVVDAKDEVEVKASITCTGVDPFAFTYVGVVGFGKTIGIASGGYKYGSLSGDTGHDDLFDGRHLLWGQEGGSYVGGEQKPGGVELRFPEPVGVKGFIMHCVKDDVADGCRGGGEYDFNSGKVEFWNGKDWETALVLSERTHGDWLGIYTGPQMSKNWRWLMDYNQHNINGQLGSDKVHISELEVLQACYETRVAEVLPEGLVCGGVDPFKFVYVGVIGYADDVIGITTGGYKYGSLSADEGHDAIFDGRHTMWGSDGEKESGGGYVSEAGKPGGVELRFPFPTTIKGFMMHCIKNEDSKLGGCAGDGAFDFNRGMLQYWDGAVWATAVSHEGRTHGNWEDEYEGGIQSQNWRWFMPFNQHNVGNQEGDARVHIAELEITEACAQRSDIEAAQPETEICSGVDPFIFKYVGKLDPHDGAVGIASGGYKFASLGSDYGNDDLFDGHHIMWGSDMDSADQPGVVGVPGGVEVRFPRPVSVNEFAMHCIKNGGGANQGGCYQSTGRYDFTHANFQYWDIDSALWKNIDEITTNDYGNWEGRYIGSEMSKNWRWKIPYAPAYTFDSQDSVYLSELDLIKTCRVPARNGVADTANCRAIDPYDFKYVGVVGSENKQFGVHQPYAYGALSADHGADMIFDGRHLMFGSDDEEAEDDEKSTGYVGEVGKPGGVEIRFQDPTTIRGFVMHCIKDGDSEKGGCAGQGDFDFSVGYLQYWDSELGSWQDAVHHEGKTFGNWEGNYLGDAVSLNWRWYLPAGNHKQGDSRVHISELEITKACVARLPNQLLSLELPP